MDNNLLENPVENTQEEYVYKNPNPYTVNKFGATNIPPMEEYTWEEVEKINEEYYKKEDEAVPAILADGFTEFPIMFESFGKLVWDKCYLPPGFVPSCSPGFREKHGMDYNIYIPSFGRAEHSLTAEMLKSYGMENFYMCIHPSQYQAYKAVHGPKNIIIRPARMKNRERLDTGSSVITADRQHGAVSGFNSCLYISKSLGEDKYWTMDDDVILMAMKCAKTKELGKGTYNKDNFYRHSNLIKSPHFNLRNLLGDIDKFSNTLRNESFISLEKFGLVWQKPVGFTKGTRSYSFYLTNNSRGIDHVGRQNNDIITSLRYSRWGYVNLILNGICYHTPDTQAIPGGQTTVYNRFKTLDKGQILCSLEPAHSKIAVVYNRIHHKADFNNFRKMRVLGKAKPKQWE